MLFRKYNIANFNFVHVDVCDHTALDHARVHFISKNNYGGDIQIQFMKITSIKIKILFIALKK